MIMAEVSWPEALGNILHALGLILAQERELKGLITDDNTPPHPRPLLGNVFVSLPHSLL